MLGHSKSNKMIEFMSNKIKNYFHPNSKTDFSSSVERSTVVVIHRLRLSSGGWFNSSKSDYSIRYKNTPLHTVILGFPRLYTAIAFRDSLRMQFYNIL